MPIPALLLVASIASADTFTSSRYPIQVEATDPALGAEALAMSEEMWEDQVEGMGFAIPRMLRLRRDDTGCS